MKQTFRAKRHHDDEYHDAVVLTQGGEVLVDAKIVPRWKTSGLSGDEWRISIIANVPPAVSEEPLRFMSFKDLFLRLPGQMIASRWLLGLSDTEGVLRGCARPLPTEFSVRRKGHVLYTHTFADPVLALTGMWNRFLVDGEDDGKVVMLTDAQEREVCQQPGCWAPPTVLYRLKSERCATCGQKEEEIPPPAHIWFCERHKTRGDCGLEDADANYEEIAT